ncbi:hypothetical protein [Streptomyces sp. NRRL S-350]|uniref:hypothetical protein n=1 Tax=Streptomyces sp. NRRL S-350 TaxID=1463902 RepID=UPI0007C457E5|nr:hypothetical protein [Streptomyces sp. NRRL S-350]
MDQPSRERPLHDMGGSIGPAETAGSRDEQGAEGPERRPSPIGKGDTPNVAGSAEQQPEIAEGPVPGVQPGEDQARGSSRPPAGIDPPTGTALPRDAAGPAGTGAGEPLEQQSEPEPGSHDPGASPEDEGIPDLQDGSPAQEWSQDPQVQSVPGDAPVAAESFGTTGAEQAQGESLDARLAQEEPEPDPRTVVSGPPEEAAGRLDQTGRSSDLRTSATGDTAGLSAEEESVRIRRDTETDPDPGAAEDAIDGPGVGTPADDGAPGGPEDAEGDVPPR